MRKTKYFKLIGNYNQASNRIDQLVEQRDSFLKENEKNIAKIDSEDLKVEYIGNNQCICIITLTYYLK